MPTDANVLTEKFNFCLLQLVTTAIVFRNCSFGKYLLTSGMTFATKKYFLLSHFIETNEHLWGIYI